MTLLVLGTDRETERQLLAQGLGEGHRVRAFVPEPGAEVGPHRLRTLGRLEDEPLPVEEALYGAEAVLWASGAGAFLPEKRVSELICDVLGVMEKNGIRRFVFLSCLNAAESRRRAALFSALVLLPLFRRELMREAETQERHVRDSPLDWTIVRPGTLTEGPRTGAYRLGFGAADVPEKPTISFADAADFMLRLAQDGEYLGTTLNLFY